MTTAFILLLIWGISSCKKDPKAATSPVLNMNFSLSAGTAPLIPGPGNVVTNTPLRYYINYVQFYVGYPRLVKSDGTEVPLSNLFLVEFNDNPLATPNLVYNNVFSFTIPAGSYTGIKFDIGVPDPILDTIRHYHYGFTDPLAQWWGMLWPTSDSIFRNIAIEMLADTSVQQNQAINRLYDFHILEESPNSHAVALYSDLLFPDAFTVSNGDSHTAIFNLDFNKVIFNSTSPINLRTSISTDMNTTPSIAFGEIINKNFYSSISKQ